MKLILRKWNGKAFDEEVIEGPSPCAYFNDGKWILLAITAFSTLGFVEVFLSPFDLHGINRSLEAITKGKESK